jgi:hypothetical protein
LHQTLALRLLFSLNPCRWVSDTTQADGLDPDVMLGLGIDVHSVSLRVDFHRRRQNETNAQRAWHGDWEPHHEFKSLIAR